MNIINRNQGEKYREPSVWISVYYSPLGRRWFAPWSDWPTLLPPPGSPALTSTEDQMSGIPLGEDKRAIISVWSCCSSCCAMWCIWTEFYLALRSCFGTFQHVGGCCFDLRDFSYCSDKMCWLKSQLTLSTLASRASWLNTYFALYWINLLC